MGNKTREEFMERDYHQAIQPLMELIRQQGKDFKEYKESDFAWKQRAEPVIAFYQNLTFTNKAFVWFLKMVVSVGAAIGFIFAAIKYLK